MRPKSGDFIVLTEILRDSNKRRLLYLQAIKINLDNVEVKCILDTYNVHKPNELFCVYNEYFDGSYHINGRYNSYKFWEPARLMTQEEKVELL